MQNSGQYGVSDAPQYVVGRQPAPPHLFSISHDNMSIATPAAHALHAPQHHLPHHLQAQHHHFGPHPGHQPHPSLQQIHQSQSHAQRSQQHPQFPHPSQQPQAQHQQQSAQQAAAPHQDVQQQAQQAQQEHQLAQQQAMVQQLGLGGADSPEVPSPGVSRPSPTKFNSQQQQQLVVAAAAQAQEDDGLDEGRSAGGSRWPRQETLALIKIRSEMDTSFRDSGLKGPLWEEVSRKLGEQGYSRTAKKCKEKFENVHKYYKKTKDGKAGRQDGKSYRFFSQLEALYSGQQEAAMQLGSRLAASAAASLLTDTAAAASLLTGSAVPAGKADESNGLQQQTTTTTAEVSTESISDDDDDDYDEPESSEHPEKSSKKRKRTKAGDLFSNLMNNLVAKQESMQRTFLEFMERREQERQARDETWRTQELARVAREHELRVQEQHLAATRDAALVAFLQKVTGQTLSLPTSRPVVATPQTHPAPASLQLVTVASADTDPESRDSPVDPNSKRWPKPEVLTLIKLRSDMEPRFLEPGPKALLWEEISQGMACLGYNRNQKRCKEKWENINKYFRKTKESNKKRPENAKTCPYFHQLELLYTQGVLGTSHNKQQGTAKAPEVDHHAVPLAQRIDTKLLPEAAADSGNGSNPGHRFSSPENGSSADRKAPESST